MKTTKTTKRQPKPVVIGKPKDLDMSLPPADASRETLTKRLRELEQVGLDFNRRLGRVRWIQGHILARLKPTYSPEEWQAFLRSVNCSQSMDKYCRAIAKKITESQSKRLGYYEMLQICYPSFRAEMEKPEADEVQSGTEPGASGQAPAGEAVALAAPVQPVQLAATDPEPPTPPADVVTVGTVKEALAAFQSELDRWGKVEFSQQDATVLEVEVDRTRGKLASLKVRLETFAKGLKVA